MQIANFPFEQTRLILTALSIIAIVPTHPAVNKAHTAQSVVHSQVKHAHHHVHHSTTAHK